MEDQVGKDYKWEIGLTLWMVFYPIQQEIGQGGASGAATEGKVSLGQ